MKKKNAIASLVLLFVFLLLGLIASVQVRSVMIDNEKKAQATVKLDKFKDQLKEQRDIAQKLEEEITSLQNEINSVINDFVESHNNPGLSNQSKDLEYYRLAAGLTDVQGPGIVLSVNDAEKSLSDNFNLYIVHEMDLVRIVNELKKAGAQAIAINDQRLIATSEQLCIGTMIRINKRRNYTPFVFRAIGDPEILYKAIDESAVLRELRDFSLRVDLQKSTKVVIPKYVNISK